MKADQLEILLDLLKALAHESRLRILGLLATRERSVSELAELLDLKEPTVSHHLAKLHELGLVGMRSAGTTHFYQFNGDALRRLNRELLTPEQVTTLGHDFEGEAWERKVLRSFLVDDRLTKIPDTRKKRLVILKWLVGQFEEGVRYSEQQLNAILKRYHPDTATLRREFIANRLMQRENGVYWRVPPPEDDQIENPASY
jgi:DNA-binding transcriptional ArsR family regulator